MKTFFIKVIVSNCLLINYMCFTNYFGNYTIVAEW